MNTIECINTRRSVRKYTDKEISQESLNNIVKAAAMAPSWKNTQTSRWNIITDKKLIEKISNEAVLGFEKNAKTIGRCTCLAVQTVVTGLAGYEPDGSFTTSKNDGWEMYDAGIAAQTFCLAAHEMGIGTVIMGIIDDVRLAELLDIPDSERVIAAIAMGYPEFEPNMPPRKSVEEISRYY
ncbi:MAG: nitroreductase family protein [Oscillospiraceae bacterium]|nr:nitroreductase family protein [Oscillospiraceae bacterium]